MRKNFTLATAALIGTAAFGATNLYAQQKPNLILFIADDCSHYDLGCYGSVDSRTPNIDKLATEGMLFEKAYQAAPVSSPTRHNLYTGIWPVKSGAYPNHTFAKEGTKSIVHHLKPAGYKVALIGKSHVNPDSVFPWDYYSHLKKGSDINFDDLDSFIKECTENGDPFCVFVACTEPHTPWNKGDVSQFNQDKVTLPPMFVDLPITRKSFVNYLAEVNYMDNEFGKVLNIVDKYKIADNSVVVYTSEQGNSFPFAKWTCYDAGVHTGFIVRWPGVIKPGSRSSAMIEYVDVVPTFLEIAGAKPQGELDGESFVSVLKGKKKEHKKYTFSQETSRGIFSGPEYYGIRSVADKKYRYIKNLTPGITFQNTTTESKMFQAWQEKGKTDAHAKEMSEKYQKRPGIELYDVENDPYCMNNLADKPEYKKVIARLDKELKKWMDYCGDLGQETEMRARERMVR